MLDKAGAKLNGGYSNMVFGESLDPLKALTGYFVESPYMSLSVNNIKQIHDLWNKIKLADETDFILCAGTKNEALVESKGLVVGHAYSLQSAREGVFNDDTLKLVRLHNPLGKGEWNGFWSDNYSLWTPELEGYYGKETKDDELFMELDDFIRYYNSVYICHMMYGAQLTYYSFEGEEASKPVIFKFSLEDDKTVAFSVLLKDWRLNRDIDLRNAKTRFSLILAKYSDKNEIEKVWTTTSVKNHDIEFVNDLIKGNYFVLINKIHSTLNDFSPIPFVQSGLF